MHPPITVIGSGYVGLVTGACFADAGHRVVCLDRDAAKVAMLARGVVPFHEPGLDVLLRRNAAAGRLSFTTDEASAVRHGRLVFLAVGTPQGEDGSADLSHALDAARGIGRHCRHDVLVVNKSTVPVGTADRVRDVIRDELRRRGVSVRVSVASNPEFLKEGVAVADFQRPDRVVIGTDADDPQALALLRAVYEPCLRAGARLLAMDVRSAELTKYAANAMLATRISFMNELAALAEDLDADIDAVRQGIGADPRIGAAFLQPGPGYGGSCLPKDVKALVHAGRERGHALDILRAVDAVNERQKRLLARRVVATFGERLDGRRFAVWGLAFKPGTDDLREAPALAPIAELRARGAALQLFDPVAMPAARTLLGDDDPGLRFAPDALTACDGADALLVVTDWPAFRAADPAVVASRLRRPLVFDGRNLWSPQDAADAGLDYRPIGRPRVGARPRPVVAAAARVASGACDPMTMPATTPDDDPMDLPTTPMPPPATRPPNRVPALHRPPAWTRPAPP